MEHTPVCHKRKRDPSPTDENVKRLAREIECNGAPQPESPPRSRRSPRLSVPFHRLREPVTLEELAELLHFASLGKTGGVNQPSWCRLRGQSRVSGVSVVVLEGLTQDIFYRHYLEFPHLRSTFRTRCSFTPTSGNVINRIFDSEVPASESSTVSHGDRSSGCLDEALRWHPVIQKFGTKTRGLTAYTLSQEEMIKKRFPVKGMPGNEECVCTLSDECVSDSSPLYGLDCEMCLTERGNELARVSLVDSRGRCILDQLVQPPNRILNYLTRFSGITRAMLKPITTTLRDVQSELRELLPRDAVLVGHSLDNDLRALKLIHPHVIDTSLLYRKEFGQRFKLKVLAETILQKQIQSEERKGHDPTEDAQAALELAQYFITTGPRQILERHGESLWGQSPSMVESPASRDTHAVDYRFAEVLRRSGQSTVFIGNRGDITLDLSNQQWHSSDREVLLSSRRRLEEIPPSLSLVQFSSFSSLLKHTSPLLSPQHRVCVRLREMCVVFAGPLPQAYTEKEVKRLFSCCGTVRNVRMLNATSRVHAEVEFELLEGAQLAVGTVNGLLLHGEYIKVQRPVKESMLGLDIYLAALQDDPLNANLIYAAGLKANANRTQVPAKVNGNVPHANCPELPLKVNGNVLHANGGELHATCPELAEQDLKDTFGRFGRIEGIVMSAKASGKRSRRHALIKYQSSESAEAVLNSPVELWDRKSHTCPALTPPHLRSWVTTGTTPAAELPGDQDQDQEVASVMRKLDGRVRKLFRSLPEHALSIVLLPGVTGPHGNRAGLCFMEVKQATPPLPAPGTEPIT